MDSADDLATITRLRDDLALLRHAPYFPPQAPFRRTVGRLEIEEAHRPKSLWARLKRLFLRRP